MHLAYSAMRKDDDEDDWAWALKTSARFELRMRMAFFAYLKVLQAALDEMGDGDPARSIPRLPWQRAHDVLASEWKDAVKGVVLDAGNHQDKKNGFGRTFTLDNPYTAEWLAMHGAELVTEVSWETQLAIRQQVYLGTVRQETAAETARQVRQMIGLHTQQQQALNNFRNKLGQEGYTPAHVDEKAKKRAAQMLAERADLIARTETMEGLNAGTRQSWQHARDKWLLLPSTVRRWIAGVGSDRTCPRCLSFAGQEAPLDGVYTSTAGETRRGPGAHPGCRCSERLVTKVPAANSDKPAADAIRRAPRPPDPANNVIPATRKDLGEALMAVSTKMDPQYQVIAAEVARDLMFTKTKMRVYSAPEALQAAFKTLEGEDDQLLRAFHKGGKIYVVEHGPGHVLLTDVAHEMRHAYDHHMRATFPGHSYPPRPGLTPRQVEEVEAFLFEDAVARALGHKPIFDSVLELEMWVAKNYVEKP